MKMREFTPEELTELRNNPHTYLVDKCRLRLTLEAKQKIMEMSAQGHSAIYIVKKLGYKISILGEKRARGLVARVRQQALSAEGLREDYKRRDPKRLPLDDLDQLPVSLEAFNQIKNELVYLRQEVEFLKKISSVEKQNKRGGSQ